ncbi:MAG: ADP-ribosylglycohydrolase family protein [Ruminococcaceae bacterium]|nr:ADP-ribosylglycohydrolase family protein [Oscillospiraceae bacterium]
MKHAWEINREILLNTVPEVQHNVSGAWEEQLPDFAAVDIADVRMKCKSRVPGSLAQERVLVGGIQAVGNMGYDVSEAEAMIPAFFDAYDKNDNIALLQMVPKIYETLGRSPKIEGHPYWSFIQYDSFEQYEKSVSFPKYDIPKFDDKTLFEKLHAAWLAQIAGAAVGTMIEGYCTDRLREYFGEIRGYLREPSTLNDDVLFELAFLEAFADKGYDVTSEDIAMNWLGKTEFAWSAEEVAMKNLKRGVFPPMSASLNNPWREWIGAQMRGAICGLVAPGDPYTAARLAWIDGCISHVNNGIIGEIFNAVMTSLAFVETDIRTIVKKSIDMIPADSEYYSVVKFALDECKKHDTWEPAWRACEEKLYKYNWIHSYPNAAAEVVSLWFAQNDFDECMHICAMCGQDVDCNAAQIATLYGVIWGYDAISESWTKPFNDKFESVYRGFEDTTITRIATLTFDSIKKHMVL